MSTGIKKISQLWHNCTVIRWGIIMYDAETFARVLLSSVLNLQLLLQPSAQTFHKFRIRSSSGLICSYIFLKSKSLIHLGNFIDVILISLLRRTDLMSENFYESPPMTRSRNQKLILNYWFGTRHKFRVLGHPAPAPKHCAYKCVYNSRDCRMRILGLFFGLYGWSRPEYNRFWF